MTDITLQMQHKQREKERSKQEDFFIYIAVIFDGHHIWNRNSFSADGTRISNIPQINQNYGFISRNMFNEILVFSSLSSSSSVFGRAWKPSLNHCQRNMKVYPEPNLSRDKSPAGTNLSRSILNRITVRGNRNQRSLQSYFSVCSRSWQSEGAFLVSRSNTDCQFPQRQEAEMLQRGSDRNNETKVTEAGFMATVFTFFHCGISDDGKVCLIFLLNWRLSACNLTVYIVSFTRPESDNCGM